MPPPWPRRLPPGVTLVGIDDATALLLPEAQVLGTGHVTVYGPGEPRAYDPGAEVELTPRLT